MPPPAITTANNSRFSRVRAIFRPATRFTCWLANARGCDVNSRNSESRRSPASPRLRVECSSVSPLLRRRHASQRGLTSAATSRLRSVVAVVQTALTRSSAPATPFANASQRGLTSAATSRLRSVAAVVQTALTRSSAPATPFANASQRGLHVHGYFSPPSRSRRRPDGAHSLVRSRDPIRQRQSARTSRPRLLLASVP